MKKACNDKPLKICEKVRNAYIEKIQTKGVLKGGSFGAIRPTPWINKIYGFPEVFLPEQKKSMNP